MSDGVEVAVWRAYADSRQIEQANSSGWREVAQTALEFVKRFA